MLDLHADLAAGVRDADGAWRFIRRFAEGYAEPIGAGDGFAEDDLRAAEQRLGLSLPKALCDLYTLFGRRRDLTDVQDRLLAPWQLQFDPTGQVLEFRVENQHVTRWGIEKGALAEPDPPVVLKVPGGGWRNYLDRVSLAAVEMAMSEWILDGDIADNRQLEDEPLDRWFRRLPLPDYPLWAEPDGAPTRWYATQDTLLRVDDAAWLWVRARTPEALDEVRDKLPGDWIQAPV
ncbi:hypothetical protein ABT369_42935 [Dactylosporangium sp. NPDC000244]|uniref:hypothetical protein n=1 Tax=Dactylosporangium sp. NPDC000244 TaxID=3154365 RepID=UPI00332F25B7